MKEVAFKNTAKIYFTRLYISTYPFISTKPLLAAMSFFPFSSKIPYAYCLNGSTPKKKLHQLCYCEVRTLQTKSAMYKQCKQNSRDFVKKVLVIKLDPKDFDKSTRLSVLGQKKRRVHEYVWLSLKVINKHEFLTANCSQ